MKKHIAELEQRDAAAPTFLDVGDRFVTTSPATHASLTVWKAGGCVRQS